MKQLIYNSQISFDRRNWFHLVSMCLGKAVANQRALSDRVVKDRDWNVDFQAGIISFGSDHYPIQFLGSESLASNTWLWGYNNINHFPDEFLTLAKFVKHLGDDWGLEALRTPSFELDALYNGHLLASVVCCLSPDNIGYYRGTHDGGAVLVAFSNIPEEVFAPVDAFAFTSITRECLQQHDLNHVLFVEGFLYQNNTDYEWVDHTIIAHFEDKLSIEFEEVNDFTRLKRIKTL